MNKAELIHRCTTAILEGTNVYLTLITGCKLPRSFPRGELMCVNENEGSTTKLYDPIKILAWLQKEIKKDND